MLNEIFKKLPNDFCFLPKMQSKEQFKADIICLYDYFKQQDKKCVNIYLEDTYDFLIVFFAALLANFQVTVLQRVPENLEDCFNEAQLETILKQYVKNLPANHTFPSLAPNTRFYLQTSGSTGNSKSIEKTLQSMIHEAKFLIDEFSISADNSFYSSVLHQHLFGLTFKVFIPLLSGAKIFTQRLHFPEDLFSVTLYKNPIFLASPAVLEIISQNPQVAKIGNFMTIFTAGSALSPSIREKLEKFTKSPIVDIYGSTETGVIARSVSPNELLRFKPVSLNLSNHETLITQSPWCENFISNDCVIIEGDNLKLLGRQDRIFKVNDMRFSLDELEAFLKTCPYIQDCYCAILQDLKHKIATLIVLSDKGKQFFKKFGKQGIVQSVREHLKTKFNQYGSRVKSFKIIHALPYNSQGKITQKDFLKAWEGLITPRFIKQSMNDNEAIWTTTIYEDCFYFEGHFADFPILPGFVTLEFVVKLAKESFGLDLAYATYLKNIKFTSFIRPLDTLVFYVQRLENRVNFKVFIGEDKLASSGYFLVDNRL